MLSFTPYVFGSSSATPDYEFLNATTGAATTVAPLGATSPAGAPLTPQTMRAAYGLGTYVNSSTINYNISFNGVQGDGSGQTIAIVDVGSDPDIAADLATFDAYYNLPNPPSLQQLSDTGTTTLPGVTQGWPGEISLDVEWSHVMAPKANIILFASSDLYAADQYAGTYKGGTATDLITGNTVTVPAVSVVSQSFTAGGAPDSDFAAAGVSYFAGNGDTGSEVPSPAQDADVVAVGGTNLQLKNNTYGSESAWSAGGGGVSGSESQPAWQNGIVSAYSTTQRTTPDVSMDADPGSGVAIVDSYDSPPVNGVAQPWELIIGGTSLATPLLAGTIAVADQGRVSEGLTNLSSTQLLTRFYELSQSNYSLNFHDVTTGNNGHPATTGYDLATGLGTVNGANLLPDLAGGGTVSGRAFVDVNGNGTYDAGTDTPLANQTVYLDLNNDGAEEAIDPTTTTDANGNYTFPDVIGSITGTVKLKGTSGYQQQTVGTFSTKYDANVTYNLIFSSLSTAYTATASPTTTTKTTTLGVTNTGTAATGLTYTWAASTVPAAGAAVTFSPNGTAAAKTATATFNMAGTYILTVKIADASGHIATTSVTVVVTQVLTSIAFITPGNLTGGQTEQLNVNGYDQFGNLIGLQPGATWTVTAGGGTVTPSGVYTGPAAGTLATVKAVYGNLAAVTGNVPVVAIPWTSTDIGTVTVAGTAYDNNSTTTLTDTSDDIWGQSDDFHFDYQTLTGDGTITAKLLSQSSASNYIKAGVMIRNSLSKDDVMAMEADPSTSPGGPLFEWRTSTTTDAAQDATSGALVPQWLRIVRAGSTFTGYSSSDGVNWTLTGSQTLTMGSTVYVGLALSSHDSSNSATAVFSNVTVVPATAQVLTTIKVLNTPVNMTAGQSQQLFAEAYDQNGNAMATQPSFTWALNSGGGTLTTAGLFTPPTTGTLATVKVTSGTLTATGTVAVVQSPWTSTDIGSVNAPGTAYDSSTTTTLTDTSDDIWNQSDDFHFDYQTLTGDGSITAELNSQTSLSSYIKSGLMVRNSLDPASVMAMVTDPANGAPFEWRTTTGGTATQVSTTVNHTAPYWMRLTRAGTVLTAYMSPNGTTWTQVGTVTISALNSTLFIGLALTSHDTAHIATSVFSNVTIVSTSAAAPTVATAASATPSPVTGTTTALSVLGASASGESTLTYTWSTTTVPAGATAPTFSVNTTNAAKATVATFTSAGTYVFLVTITDGNGKTVTSSVSVVVNQTLTSIAVTPATVGVGNSGTTQLSATADDQFGIALSTQPSITWSVDAGGVGTVSATGLYTAPSSGQGTATVRATSGTVSGTSSITVALSVINGTSGDDVIRLVRSGTNLLVYINNPLTPVYTVPYSTLSNLTIAASTGNDTVNIDFSGGATPVPSGLLTVDAGSGSDSLIVTGTTGTDTGTINGTTIALNSSAFLYNNFESVVVNGNGGSDTLTQTAQPGNSATLAFNSSSTAGPSTTDTLNVNGGTYTFAAPAAGAGVNALSLATLSIGASGSVQVGTAAASTDRWVLALNTLSIGAAPATLDLGSNDLILHNSNASSAAQALSRIQTSLTSGRTAAGTWNGPGISSSAVAATGPLMSLGYALNSGLFTTFDGQTVTSTDVLVKYTYLGDANLDGRVDGSDYTKIDSGFLSQSTGWSNGDFDYSGTVDGSDYTLIDNAFNTQGGAISSALVATPAASTASATVSSALVTTRKSSTAITPFQSAATISFAAAASSTQETLLNGDLAKWNDVIDQLKQL